MAKKNSPALPLLVAGGALVVASKKKKKKGRSSHWGVRVTKACEIQVVDPVLFERFVLGALYELRDIDPSLDAFQLTDAMFGEVAPECSPFPEAPENSSVVKFYFTLLRANSRNLIANKIVSPEEVSSHPRSGEFIDWYRTWLNPPSPEVPSAPDNQVAFSSDFSEYVIGPNWYEQTVKPFVAGVSDGASAYEDFINHLSVAVGKLIVPIHQLPADPPSVQDFIAKVQSAIEQAQQEA